MSDITIKQGLLPTGWVYAGFSSRALAFSVDQIILMMIVFIIALPIFVLVALMQMLAWPFVFFVIVPSASLTTTGIAWLYFALQESSSRQATWGKRLCGLRVTDMNGARISFSRASVRFFMKFVSAAIMLIGFVMVAFTEKHQALHDLFAETLVLKKVK
jgi:uncharacterized RDD family membrane protein YckC